MAYTLQVTEKGGLLLHVITAVITIHCNYTILPESLAEYDSVAEATGCMGVISGQVVRQSAHTAGIELDKIAHEL